jgi:hypothetical protein
MSEKIRNLRAMKLTNFISFFRRNLRRYFIFLITLPSRLRSISNSTFIDYKSLQDVGVYSFFKFIDRTFILDLLKIFPDYSSHIYKQSLDSLSHRFNLLGSNSKVVRHGMASNGIYGIIFPAHTSFNIDFEGLWLKNRINNSNLHNSQEIWKQINSKNYIPIDWQLDFKSGYRWNEGSWYRDIGLNTPMGVDVKVPWELARLQHLPVLALACHYAKIKNKKFKSLDTYANELHNQILDFISTNPPGFGVNWLCSMDIAIRAVNLLISYDIALSAGATFSKNFKKLFISSIVAHGRHIFKNLEWSKLYRNNHYLANLAGLLFIGAYIESSDETKNWFIFAKNELFSEFDRQFHHDGSNFEGSVCYHRLSSEMILWSFALLQAIPKERLSSLGIDTKKDPLIPNYLLIKLLKAASFTEEMTRPDGLIVQFGDNDSGRFISLGSGEQILADNNTSSLHWSLNHSSLISGIRTLVLGSKKDLTKDPYSYILGGLVSNHSFTKTAKTFDLSSKFGDVLQWELAKSIYDQTPTQSRKKIFFKSEKSILQDLKLNSFPGMGCFIFRSSKLYLVIRCGEIGLNGLGAHNHCDQLSIELMLDGKIHYQDPGTLLYSPFPEMRNLYRSASAHNGPRIHGQEPADLSKNIFSLDKSAPGECLYFGPKGFCGRYRTFDGDIYRIIQLNNKSIYIYDFCPAGLSIDKSSNEIPFSQGYGRIIDSDSK